MAKRKLLVDPTDEIKINFVLGERKNGEIVGDVTIDGLKTAYTEDLVDGSIVEHWATFRRPTFGDTVDINGHLNTPDGIRLEFNPIAVRFQRMSKLIRAWSLAEDGVSIPATPLSIAQMDPFVANVIGMQLDAAIGA